MMALADYFSKNLMAASQLTRGFDVDRFTASIGAAKVGVFFDGPSARRQEGRALLDLLVRLVARLYPTLCFRGPSEIRDELVRLAQAINPVLEIDDNPTIGVCVGQPDGAAVERILFAGSDRWLGRLSETRPLSVGDSTNRTGAGAAACFAASWLFKALFAPAESQLSGFDFSVFAGELGKDQGPDLDVIDSLNPVLVGCGAIGNAALWTLADLSGEIHLVDHQEIDVTNLQRYVLAARNDEGRLKVDLGASAIGTWKVHKHPQRWAEFTSENGYAWNDVLVAVDSAKDRRAVQASLPRWIANGWTQLGDLGVSTHDFLNGACLACLYLPTARTFSEDELVAAALGIPERSREVRDLLAQGKPAPQPLLDAIAQRLEIDPALLARFDGLPIRSLYVEGICGGALLPRNGGNVGNREMEVPLAHQSAMAGVLLAGALLHRASAGHPNGSKITRLDLMRDAGEHLTIPAQKAEGNCICRDPDYVAGFMSKYG
jgi:hypothetical protein